MAIRSSLTLTRYNPEIALNFATDLKTAFNDIPTGFTPTNPQDGSMKDFSKLENIDTPTPLENPENDAVFVYPPKPEPESQSFLDLKDHQPLQHLRPNFHTTNLVTEMTNSLKIEAPHSEYAVSSGPTTTHSDNLDPNGSVSRCSHHSMESRPGIVRPNSLHLSPPAEMHIESVRYVPLSHIRTGSFSVAFLNCFSRVQTTGYMKESFDQPQNEIDCSTLDQTCQPPLPTQEVAPLHTGGYCPYDFDSRYNQAELTQTDHLNRPREDSGIKQARPKPLEKAFACNLFNCTKRFARVDELRRHQRTHSDVKQFTCDICKKGFTRSDHLMTHRRTHTGERPYQCKHCDRRFARSDECNRHTKVHFREKTRTIRKSRYTKHEPDAPDGCISSRNALRLPWLDGISIET
ncbi:unnamed protein product [Dicrocoelium dendriticum]|nr:unnamed protein product [Dicrocoelium dendriticum]